jgi:hypothetical protein
VCVSVNRVVCSLAKKSGASSSDGEVTKTCDFLNFADAIGRDSKRRELLPCKDCGVYLFLPAGSKTPSSSSQCGFGDVWRAVYLVNKSRKRQTPHARTATQVLQHDHHMSCRFLGLPLLTTFYLITPGSGLVPSGDLLSQRACATDACSSEACRRQRLDDSATTSDKIEANKERRRMWIDSEMKELLF